MKEFTEIFEYFPTILIILLVIIIGKAKKRKKGSAGHTSSKFTAGELRAEKAAGKFGAAKDAGLISPRTSTGTESAHTHNRLSSEFYVPNESVYEHYKRQLDSFLSAGLIESSEYKILLRRYTQEDK